MNDYFSDRENGPRARTEQVTAPTVWAGFVGTVQALINSGAFGLRFPERCPDGQAVCGSDTEAFAATVKVEMPGLGWPLETTQVLEDGFMSERQSFAPDTLLILDFIEFVYVVFLEIWMLGDDLRRRHAVGDEVDHMSDRNPQAAQCRAPGEHVGIMRDAIEHVSSLRLSGKNRMLNLRPHPYRRIYDKPHFFLQLDRVGTYGKYILYRRAANP